MADLIQVVAVGMVGPGGGGAAAFPLLATNGACATPPYSFAASPTSGMWFDPTLGPSGAVVISDNNCTNRINVGASIELIVESTAANSARISLLSLPAPDGCYLELIGGDAIGPSGSGGGIGLYGGAGIGAGTAGGNIDLAAGAHADAGFAGTISILGGGAINGGTAGVVIVQGGFANNAGGIAGNVEVYGGVGASGASSGDFLVVTGNPQTERLRIVSTGQWNIEGSPGAAGEVITSAGPGFSPVWAPGGVSFPLLAPDGAAFAPSYSFSSQPASGLFYDPGLDGPVFVGASGAQVQLDDSNGEARLVDATGDTAIQASAGGVELLTSTGNITLTQLGELSVNGGVGTAGQVITSGGPGVPAAWGDVTLAFPMLASSGSCAAPSYSFTSSPDSGMFYTGSAVRIGDDNCVDYIEVGASITLFTTSTTINITSGRDVIIDGGSNGVAGGTIWLQPGVGSAQGGDINAFAASGPSFGGSFNAAGGASSTGIAGNVSMVGGTAQGATSTAGYAILQSGTVSAVGATHAQTLVKGGQNTIGGVAGDAVIIGGLGQTSVANSGDVVIASADPTIVVPPFFQLDRLRIKGPTGAWEIGGTAGTAGQVITSNGVSSPPTWQTLGGLSFPLLAPNGTALAPSYSFSASSDSGMYYTGTAVRIGDDSDTDYIEVGASINIVSAASTVTTNGGGSTIAVDAASIALTGLTAGPSGASISFAGGVGTDVGGVGGSIFGGAGDSNQGQGGTVSFVAGRSILNGSNYAEGGSLVLVAPTNTTTPGGVSIVSGYQMLASVLGARADVEVYTGSFSIYAAFGAPVLRWKWRETGAVEIAGNAGTSGQFLRSSGAGSAPSWTSITSITNGGGTLSVNGSGAISASPASGQSATINSGSGGIALLRGPATSSSIAVNDLTGQILLSQPLTGSSVGVPSSGQIVVSAGAGQSVLLLSNAVGFSVELSASGELLVNSSAGTAGDRLTSQGAGLPPVWAP